MAIPSNQLQPLFLYAYDVADGQYVDVTTDFNTPVDTILDRGIYMLCAVTSDITFGIGLLSGTNGAHLPAGDTRLIVIPADNTTLSACLFDGTANAAKLNIAKVRPVPQHF